ncbi:MAG: glycosyltransferase family 2 protein [Syntrophales bacterium]|jgi:glycosyltransferase involved in cell wall biosynthesis|nr:glycosyltransferase family 2 protein [Syntrophales bacterium]
MTDKSSLSVAIITKNEEANLPACLQSVVFAAQIVVVDSGSTDGTLQIARDFGCDVFEEPWRGGFGAQKQFAIDQCRHPWVLVLDADERIPAETAAMIKRLTNIGQEEARMHFSSLPADSSRGGSSGPVVSEIATGYSFPRKNYFQGRWICHAGWWPDRLTRLFRRGRGGMSPAAVHEGVEVNGIVSPLNVPLEHFTESDLSKILQKIDRYSSLGAQEAYEAGRRATVSGAMFRAVLTFFQDYLLRLGVLDGPQGLTLAVTDSVNKFFKYAKLAEMGRKKGEK